MQSQMTERRSEPAEVARSMIPVPLNAPRNIAMKNRNFPRWSAPLVGTIAGALCGLRGGLNAQDPILFYVLGGSLIGGLAGALIFVLHPSDAVEAPVGIPIHL